MKFKLGVIFTAVSFILLVSFISLFVNGPNFDNENDKSLNMIKNHHAIGLN
jgi:hypothetical protein